MKNDRRACKLLRRQDGSVLILSVCVMMFLSMLSLVLLKTSSDLVRFHERNVRRQQCEMTAKSVAKVIQAEIEGRMYEAAELGILLEPEVVPESVCYDLENCEIPGHVSLEIWRSDAPNRLYITVICELDDVSQRVLCCYYPEIMPVDISEAEDADEQELNMDEQEEEEDLDEETDEIRQGEAAVWRWKLETME